MVQAAMLYGVVPAFLSLALRMTYGEVLVDRTETHPPRGSVETGVPAGLHSFRALLQISAHKLPDPDAPAGDPRGARAQPSPKRSTGEGGGADPTAAEESKTPEGGEGTSSGPDSEHEAPPQEQRSRLRLSVISKRLRGLSIRRPSLPSTKKESPGAEGGPSPLSPTPSLQSRRGTAQRPLLLPQQGKEDSSARRGWLSRGSGSRSESQPSVKVEFSSPFGTKWFKGPARDTTPSPTPPSASAPPSPRTPTEPGPEPSGSQRKSGRRWGWKPEEPSDPESLSAPLTLSTESHSPAAAVTRTARALWKPPARPPDPETPRSSRRLSLKRSQSARPQKVRSEETAGIEPPFSAPSIPGLKTRGKGPTDAAAEDTEESKTGPGAPQAAPPRGRPAAAIPQPGKTPAAPSQKSSVEPRYRLPRVFASLSDTEAEKAKLRSDVERSAILTSSEKSPAAPGVGASGERRLVPPSEIPGRVVPPALAKSDFEVSPRGLKKPQPTPRERAPGPSGPTSPGPQPQRTAPRGSPAEKVGTGSGRAPSGLRSGIRKPGSSKLPLGATQQRPTAAAGDPETQGPQDKSYTKKKPSSQSPLPSAGVRKAGVGKTPAGESAGAPLRAGAATGRHPPAESGKELKKEEKGPRSLLTIGLPVKSGLPTGGLKRSLSEKTPKSPPVVAGFGSPPSPRASAEKAADVKRFGFGSHKAGYRSGDSSDYEEGAGIRRPAGMKTYRRVSDTRPSDFRGHTPAKAEEPGSPAAPASSESPAATETTTTKRTHTPPSSPASVPEVPATTSKLERTETRLPRPPGRRFGGADFPVQPAGMKTYKRMFSSSSSSGGATDRSKVVVSPLHTRRDLGKPPHLKIPQYGEPGSPVYGPSWGRGAMSGAAGPWQIKPEEFFPTEMAPTEQGSLTRGSPVARGPAAGGAAALGDAQDEGPQLQQAALIMLASPGNEEDQKGIIRTEVERWTKLRKGCNIDRGQPSPAQVAAEVLFPDGKIITTTDAEGNTVALASGGYICSGAFGVVIKVTTSRGDVFAAKLSYGKVRIPQGQSVSDIREAAKLEMIKVTIAVEEELKARRLFLKRGFSVQQFKEGFNVIVTSAILKVKNEMMVHLQRDSLLILFSSIILLQKLLGPSLKDIMQVFPPPEFQGAAARALLLAVAKLHTLGLAHGDIRASNFIFDAAGNGFLIDLASVHELHDPVAPGEKTYMPHHAPEVAAAMLSQYDYNRLVREKLDVWQTGVTIFEITCDGNLPYGLIADAAFLRRRRRDLASLTRSQFSLWYCSSPVPAVAGLAYILLEPDPDKRPTISEVVSNPFFHS